MKVLLTAAAAVFLLAGCFPTLYPLFTEKDLVFEDDLLGCWTHEDSTWTFERQNNDSYMLTIVEKDDEDVVQGKFAAHLLKLEGVQYLDIQPVDVDEIKIPGFSQICLYPVHLFMKVDEISPELKLSFMDPEWLEEYLKKNPEELPAIPKNKSHPLPLITASTPRLQAFVKKHAANPEAWSETGLLSRCRDETAENAEE
jgi:hypothetical protein